MIARNYSKRIENLEAAHPPTDRVSAIEIISVEAVQTNDGMREGKRETAAIIVLSGKQIDRDDFDSEASFRQTADEEHIRVHGTPLPEVESRNGRGN